MGVRPENGEIDGARTDLTQARVSFQQQLEGLKVAAEEWGVRPDHAEGVFISSMIATQAGFAEIAILLSTELQHVADTARRAADTELERQRTINDRAMMTLDQAKAAAQSFDQEREKVTTRLVESIVPEMIKGVREKLVVYYTEKRRADTVLRFMRAGCVAAGFIMLGFAWSTWDDWPATSHYESLVQSIAKCKYSSKWTDDHGNRLCELNDIVIR